MPCEEIEITLIGFVCGVLRTSNILHKFRRAVSALCFTDFRLSFFY